MCNCINSINSDSTDIKDGIITKNITKTNGIKDHPLAFIYPILKNSGTCIPAIIEKTENDKANPNIISNKF